jgi:hypothetical protein
MNLRQYYVEALTKQNGVRLLGKLKKKLKPTYPTLVFTRRNRKPTYFFWPYVRWTINQ